MGACFQRFQRRILACGLETVLVIFGEERGCFLSLSESLPDAEGKSFGLIPLAERSLKNSLVSLVLWLLKFTLVKIYNEKRKAEQAKCPE